MKIVPVTKPLFVETVVISRLRVMPLVGIPVKTSLRPARMSVPILLIRVARGVSIWVPSNVFVTVPERRWIVLFPVLKYTIRVRADVILLLLQRRLQMTMTIPPVAAPPLPAVLVRSIPQQRPVVRFMMIFP